MAWINSSTDTGFWVGGTTNLTTESSTSAVLWKWKSLLKTAGWYVAASYNGASGAKGQDILTGTISNIGTSSWFVICQPSGSRSIYVARSTGDTWRLKYAANGFDLTGSVTAQPPGPLVTGSSMMRRANTAGNQRIDGEVCFVGTSLDSSPSFTTAPLGTINSTTAIVHIAAQNTPPYMFYILNYHSASTGLQPRQQLSGAFFLDCMESGSKATGLDDYVIFFRIPGGGYFPMGSRGLVNGAGQTAGFSSMINQTASFAQNVYGEFGYTHQSPNAGNASTNGLGWMIPPGRDGSLTSYCNSGVNGNVYNGNIMETFPVYAYTRDRWDGNSGLPRESGFKGISSLFRWKGSHVGDSVSGDTFSLASSGAMDFIGAAECLLPWFGTTPSGASNNYRIMEGVTLDRIHSSASWFDGGITYANTDDVFINQFAGPWKLYRGVVSGAYVYRSGFPPVSASDVCVVGDTFDRPSTAAYSASYGLNLDQIIALSPTLFLDERGLNVVSGEYNNWYNQAVPGTDNNDFVAATASTRPLTGSYINGYETPFFTGSGAGNNRRMGDVSGSWTSILTPISYSIFVVVSHSMLSGTNAIAYANSSIWGDTGQFLGIYSNNVASSSGIQFYNWDSNEKSTVSVPITTGTVALLEGYYVSGARSELRVNNYSTQSATVISTIGGTAGTFNLGGSTAATPTGLNGGIASVIAFDKVLSDENKRGIRLYLAKKYNIPVIDEGAITPRTILTATSGCQWWLKPSTGISGNPIDSWANQGLNGSSMVGITITRPSQSIQNGLVVPNFDGIQNYLGSSPNTFSGSLSGSNTWEIMLVSVAKSLSGASAAGTPYLEPAIWAVGAGGFGITATLSGVRAFSNEGGVTHTTPYASGTLTPHTRFLAHAYYDGTKVACRFNNGTTVSASATGDLTATANAFVLGTNYAVTNYYNGYVFEFALWNRNLSTSERAWVRTYLGSKWGVDY